MNSRSGVNESNVVNFSTGLSTLNQIDCKDGLLTIPFDHIYACHSGADRRTTLQLGKEVEVTTDFVVSDEKSISSPIELSKLQEQLSVFEKQNKHLKDLLICHLDLIQQQNEVISKKDKVYQTLKEENDILKANLFRVERGLKISPQTLALNAAYHASQDALKVTKDSVCQPTTSQIVEKCFADLLVKDSGAAVVDNKTEFKEIFGLPRLTAEPELIENYTKDPDYIPTTEAEPSYNTGKMIVNKRSLLKKEVRKEIKMARVSKPNSKKTVSERVQQRNKRKTSESNTRPTRTKLQVSETITSQGSLSDRLQLIDTTPTGEDPYQLGEADLREQSPIPKLILNKPNHNRKTTRLFNGKKDRFVLSLNQSKDYCIDQPDQEIDVVNVDGEEKFVVNNYNETDYSTIPGLEEPDFHELFARDVSLENLDSLGLGPDNIFTDSAEMIYSGEDEEDFSQPGPSNRGRKRADSTTGIGKQKPRAKPSRGAKAARAKKCPPPGVTTDAPYPTVNGDCDDTWYLFLDSDVKIDDTDPLLTTTAVEVPLWRDKLFTSTYTLEGTENINDKLFEKRHAKLEAEERRQLRWHMRRIREQRHMERLRQRHKDAWSNMPVSAPSVYTVWPRPQRDMQELEITQKLPVAAFGEDIPDLPHTDIRKKANL